MATFRDSNYDRSRGNTGRTSHTETSSRSRSGGNTGTGGRESWADTKARMRSAKLAQQGGPKYTAESNPSALANKASQIGVDKASEWSNIGGKILGGAGGMLLGAPGAALGTKAGEQFGGFLSSAEISPALRARMEADKANENYRDTATTREGQFLPGSSIGPDGGRVPGTDNAGSQLTPGALAPWQETGVTALGRQRALLGMGTPEEQEAAFAAFGNSPGQKFLRDRAEKVTMRNAPALGGLGGGNVRSALQEQAVGFAAQDFNNQFGRLGQLNQQGYNATAAGLDENFRNKLNAQQLSQMAQQKKAGKTEGILNLVGQFEEPISDMFSGIGDTVSDWLEW